MALCAGYSANAQNLDNAYINVDWQLNIPVNNDFANKISGWGMNFEGGYFLGGGDFAIGGFVAFHTNNEYKGAQVVSIGDNGSLFTDQQHSIYRLPFGAAVRYRLNDGSGMLVPYLAMKIGPQFARMESFYNQYESYDNTWGFYFSPEVGVTIWPDRMHSAGIHVAAYYDYGTNSTDMVGYSVDNLNNFGLRFGVQF